MTKQKEAATPATVNISGEVLVIPKILHYYDNHRPGYHPELVVHMEGGERVFIEFRNVIRDGTINAALSKLKQAIDIFYTTHSIPPCLCAEHL